MDKRIVIGLTLLVTVALLFGCTSGGGEAVKINSNADAAKAINDVGTDLSGISNTLDDVDTAFTDTNSP